jgi:hypothetical protein
MNIQQMKIRTANPSFVGMPACGSAYRTIGGDAVVGMFTGDVRPHTAVVLDDAFAGTPAWRPPDD